MSERFDELYELGVPDELPAEREITERRASTPFALHGCVLTPDEQIEKGYVTVSGSKIESIGTTKPDGPPIVETDGVIVPGLIDLHGHPEYNVFAAWEPPRLYLNRAAWRRSPQYAQIVKEPWAKLTDPKATLLRELTRYAEARALVGGVTAIQGASAKYPDKQEALVRNVDLRIFGEHKARSIIDLDRKPEKDRQTLKGQIDNHEVTAVYIHLAEGIGETSSKEFKDLTDSHLLTEATVIIHGTALSDEQLGDVKDAGAKLVWSPQSNLRLYAQTTHAKKALELGIPLGLGADWLPSGSISLLAELKVARRQLLVQGFPAEGLAKRLVHAVTAGAAEIAALGDHLGKLEAGRPADVVVLERRLDDPWENVLAADPSWVQLVAIDGDLVYGRTDWMHRPDLIPSDTELEELLAWGAPMALDTSYVATPDGSPPIRLKYVRAALLERYPQSGPIFA